MSESRTKNSYKNVNCNLCGSANRKTLFTSMLPGEEIMKCADCGLIYRYPQRTGRDSEDSYEYNYDNMKKGKEKLFLKNLIKFEKYAEKGRLLDIGCGDGYFLGLAKDRGWDVYGVELSRYRCDLAKGKGIKTFCGFLRDAAYPDNYFDVITLWDVLSMLTDPISELTEIRRILKDDGLLVVRTRNALFHVNAQRFFGFIFQILKISPVVFHFYSFTPGITRKLFGKAGFKIESLSNSILTAGDPYGSGAGIGTFTVTMIKFLFALLCEGVYYLSFGSLVISSSMDIYATKNS